MMAYVAVRLKRGKLVHAVSQGADSPTTTFCGRPAAKVVVPVSDDVTCTRCRSWISR